MAASRSISDEIDVPPGRRGTELAATRPDSFIIGHHDCNSGGSEEFAFRLQSSSADDPRSAL
jgi:hypothetical protein